MVSCGEEESVEAEVTSGKLYWPRATKWPKFASYEWGATKDEMTQAFAAEGFKWDEQSIPARGKILGKNAYITPTFSPSGGLHKLSIVFHTDEQDYGDFFDELSNLLNKKYTAPSKRGQMLSNKNCWLCPEEIEANEQVLKLSQLGRFDGGWAISLDYFSKEYVKANISQKIELEKQREERRNHAKEREKQAKERAKEQEKDF